PSRAAASSSCGRCSDGTPRPPSWYATSAGENMRSRLIHWLSGRAPGRLRQAALERPRALVSMLVLASVLAWAAFGYTLWFAWDVRRSLPDGETLRGVGDMAQTTTIYDADDEPVFTIFKEQRIEVPLERISPHMIAAVLSVEDQRFYQHNGID